MNVIFDEVSFANNEYHVHPVFLNADEIAYVSAINIAFIVGRNGSVYKAPMTKDRYLQLFCNASPAGNC